MVPPQDGCTVEVMGLGSLSGIFHTWKYIQDCYWVLTERVDTCNYKVCTRH